MWTSESLNPLALTGNSLALGNLQAALISLDNKTARFQQLTR